MSRGLYGTRITPGTYQEAALVAHQVTEEAKETLVAMLIASSSGASDRRKTLRQVRETFQPGSIEAERVRDERDVAFLRSLRDINWSRVISIPESYRKEIEDREAVRAAGGIGAEYLPKVGL